MADRLRALVTTLTHLLHELLSLRGGIQLPELILNVLLFTGFACGSCLTAPVWQDGRSHENQFGQNSRQHGACQEPADNIYKRVTSSRKKLRALRKGSHAFRKSMEEVTAAIEDIAEGTMSIVADSEK